MAKRHRLLFSVCALASLFCLVSRGLTQTNLGMVGIKSTHGRYLQAHTDGELHASNDHRNEEETWFLYEVNKEQHQYALLNWKNGRFMSKRTNGCAPAVSVTLTGAETWELVSGKPYGVLNAVALKAADGTFLGAAGPGDDEPCGGEVGAHSGGAPQRSGDWPGWWVMESATTPSPGKDFWNTVGGAVQGIVNQITPADVAGLLALLA
jgi:hypothetical protein